MGVLESLGNHRLVMPLLTMLVAWWCFLDVSWTFQTSATEPKILIQDELAGNEQRRTKDLELAMQYRLELGVWL